MPLKKTYSSEYSIFLYALSLILRCFSVQSSMLLRYKIAPSPTLHRLCTDFGTEDQRRKNGGIREEHTKNNG